MSEASKSSGSSKTRKTNMTSKTSRTKRFQDTVQCKNLASPIYHLKKINLIYGFIQLQQIALPTS